LQRDDFAFAAKEWTDKASGFRQPFVRGRSGLVEKELMLNRFTRLMGELMREWTTFLLVMLYTAMRPQDAARVKRRDIDLEKGTIKVKSSKTAGFNRKREPKPMHDALLSYLREMFA